MAKDSHPDRRPLTRSRLTALYDLTKAISEAVVHGDLDRALILLEQREKAFNRLDWSSPHGEQFEPEMLSLWELNGELLNFCRTWRDVLQGRLENLGACHRLWRHYSPSPQEASFVDVRE